MAKKGQAAQLQAELNTDEEWNKMLEKSGLILVDIYSEWAGPCSAMAANLKKIKLETGGDNLQLAVAKSDTISYLERFRGTCEPTWMFIANGQMVNLMFGADSPKLMSLITDELNKEAAVKEGTRKRQAIEISELSPEESVRYEKIRLIEEEKIRIKTEKIAQQLRERRLAVANVVLENIGPLGVIIVFPQAVDQVQSILGELWEPSGFALQATEKPTFTEEMIEELLYFSEVQFSEADVANLISAKCIAYLVKPYDVDLFSGDMDVAIAEFIYGPSKAPPGSPESPAEQLIAHVPVPKEEPTKSSAGLRSGEPSLGALPSMPSLSGLKIPSSAKQSKVVIGSKAEMQSKTKMGSKKELRSKADVGSKAEVQSKANIQSKTKMQSKTGVTSKTLMFSQTSIKDIVEEETIDITGLWSPPNAYTKATAIKLIFKKVYDPIALPEPVPTPPHIAIAFEVYRRREVYEFMNEYPNEIMRVGFFSTDDPETAQLLAKTPKKYEKLRGSREVEGEKIVIQLSRKRSEAWCYFSQQAPCFMSHTPEEGEEQCKLFFPEGYDEPEEEEEEVVVVKKKSRKGKKGKAAEKKKEVGEEGEEEEAAEEGEDRDEEEEDLEEEEDEEEGEGEEDGENEDDAIEAPAPDE